MFDLKQERRANANIPQCKIKQMKGNEHKVLIQWFLINASKDVGMDGLEFLKMVTQY